MTAERIRQAALRARRNLDVAYRNAASARIAGDFLSSAMFFSARRLACYLSMHDEVDTSQIFERAWRAGKAIYAPVIVPNRPLEFVRVDRDTRLQKCAFGVWEPVDGEKISPRQLDVVVTPTVAVDADRHRIGLGGGYYDRTFAFLANKQRWLRPKLVGLVFDCQKVEKIKPNPWDIRLYRIFSESM